MEHVEEPPDANGDTHSVFYPCQNNGCLLANTPPVGIFELDPRSMEDSLLGKVKQGRTFDMGRAKLKSGNVDAAYSLLEREYAMVKLII